MTNIKKTSLEGGGNVSRFSEKDKENYGRRLLEIGEKMFNEQELKDVTVDDIVKQVGIGKGTFYHYFKNKEQLFMEISNNRQEELFLNMGVHLEGKNCPKDKFYKAIHYLLEEIAKYPMLAEIDEKTYVQLKKKVPEETKRRNEEIDKKLISELEEHGIKFKITSEQTRKLLQLLFVDVTILRKQKEYETIDLLLRSIGEYIVYE